MIVFTSWFRKQLFLIDMKSVWRYQPELCQIPFPKTLRCIDRPAKKTFFHSRGYVILWKKMQ